MAGYVTEETNKRARQGSHQDVITFLNAPLFLIYLEHPLNYKPLRSGQPAKTPGQEPYGTAIFSFTARFFLFLPRTRVSFSQCESFELETG